MVAGKAPPNQPATTTLALIEQAGSVRKGIYKRIYRSFGQELRNLRTLNAIYLDEEEYFQLNDEDAVQVGRADYADKDLDVIPVADPTQISSTHRMARAQAMWTMFNGDPLVNQQMLRQTNLEALGATDIQKWLEVPPPQPDPKLLVDMGKLDIEKRKAANDTTRAQAEAAGKFMTAAKDAAEIGLLPDAAILAAHSVEESGEEDALEQQGGLSGMGPEPADQGVPGAPPQEAGALDGGMGGGPMPDAGGAIAGGPSGPVEPPPL